MYRFVPSDTDRASRSPFVAPEPRALPEYVSAEKIENVINQSPLVGQAFVHGDSYQTYLVAVVVPDEEPVREWAKAHLPGAAAAPFVELCRADPLREEILADIRRLSKRHGLHGFETVKAVFLEPTAFDGERGLITPTFKLKRPQLKAFYAEELKRMYVQPPSKL